MHYETFTMISDTISDTKIQFSDEIVRHKLPVTSAKASNILRYFSHSTLNTNLAVDLSRGLSYFSGHSSYDSTNLCTNFAHPFSEVIAFCPQWLLSARASNQDFRTTKLLRQPNGQYQESSKVSSPNEYLSELRRLQPPTMPAPRKKTSKTPTFEGGLVGFIGYDLAAQQHIQSHTDQPSHSEHLVAAIGDYDIFLKNEADGWVLYRRNNPTLEPLIQQIIGVLALLNAGTPTHSNAFSVRESFKATWSFDQYARAFQRIQDYLHAGDCYQVNLTQPFVASVNGDLLEVMDDLFALTRAPYSGYMRVDEHELLSCSPELFLAFSGVDADGKNQMITRPIKGTRPRHDDSAQDLSERNALIMSEKDQSENLMIVDLLRNDLSLHAEVGSVTVPALFEIESFAQVHHLVSEVRATLCEDTSVLDVLIDALPGGSITGAPKKRAMEIIAELEAAPRGAYCGSFGYLNRDGSGQFNVLIRTLQKHQDHLVAWAGGGITIASQVESEYQECLDKISAILNCVNGFGSVQDH